MSQLFVQMSGAPGSGKTTLAHAIAPHIGAVVIDHDVTKSALLQADLVDAAAGRASYSVLAALARHLLTQGHSVIQDSPCFYTELLERGQRQAAAAGATYRYIECVVDDLHELDRRLRGRAPLPSQTRGLGEPIPERDGKTSLDEELLRQWITGMKRPPDGYLTLDTTRPLDVCVEEALAYLEPTGRVDERPST